jgi:hypothetical protein
MLLHKRLRNMKSDIHTLEETNRKNVEQPWYPIIGVTQSLRQNNGSSAPKPPNPESLDQNSLYALYALVTCLLASCAPPPHQPKMSSSLAYPTRRPPASASSNRVPNPSKSCATSDCTLPRIIGGTGSRSCVTDPATEPTDEGSLVSLLLRT